REMVATAANKVHPHALHLRCLSALAMTVVPPSTKACRLFEKDDTAPQHCGMPVAFIAAFSSSGRRIESAIQSILSIMFNIAEIFMCAPTGRIFTIQQEILL
ncbi:hypothetical protein, partial [Citrobacter sp. CK205]|uniref:hypothetical protein n=1 Tax=Citrobacter sp. CK205 TaxID=2985114 RepID=UPI002575E9AF